MTPPPRTTGDRHRLGHGLGHSLGHAVGHAVGHALHDVVDFARHHPIHLLHHEHPDHHAAVVRHEGAEMDDLEGRTLMSAAAGVDHAGGEPVMAAPAAVTVAKAAAKAKTIATKTTTPTTPAPTAGPVAIADPALTSARFSYKSFATSPLYGPGGPKITDVNQGELGDCYLMSVLSSVAKGSPGTLTHMITANANGTYTVTFGGTKKPTLVTVDADLPTIPGGRLAYAQFGAGNSIWVALVEKAYTEFAAPKADSYAAISGGWMGDAFAALGVRSASTFSSSSAAALATLVQRDLKDGDLVTFGTTTTAASKGPLVGGHAYEVDSVTVDKAGRILSFTVRNPWGNNVANNGYLTVTVAQMYASFAGLSVGMTG